MPRNTMAICLLPNLASLNPGLLQLKDCLSPGQWLLPFLENIFQTDPISLLKSFQWVKCASSHGDEARVGRKKVMITGIKELQILCSTCLKFCSFSHGVALEKLLVFF